MPDQISKSLRIPVKIVSVDESVELPSIPPLTAIPTERLALLSEVARISKDISENWWSFQKGDNFGQDQLVGLFKKLQAAVKDLNEWGPL